ncbi:MAG: hypothetical protein GX117_13315 [Candidatus Hydrogenedentes bacterium]|jgi:glycerophosphoryl diester phosphodiesterase|nr:hypothetical protein [Candidatus Hydrogenedentota bacterium]
MMMLRSVAIASLTLLIMTGAVTVAQEKPVMNERQDHEDHFTNAPLLLGAHRCGRSEWPENTLVAVREASGRWQHVLLEIDVQLSRDGHVVLMHDFAVDRTTDGTGYVGAMTLEEIRALDGAYHFSTDGGEHFPYRGKGVTVPTLEEAFAAAPNHRFFIELKDGVTIGKETAAVIQKAGMSKQCLVASVSPEFLIQFRSYAPEVATTYDFLTAANMLSALRTGGWDAYTPEHRAFALSPALMERFDITAKEVAAIRKKGILISLFTLNTEAAIRDALDLGVDNILTDKPSLLADILAQSEKEAKSTAPKNE